MKEFALSGLRSGIRGRSFQAVFVLGLVLIGVAFLAGYFSPRQPKTVALDVGLSGVRVSLVLLGLFWVQELVAKEIEQRTVLFSLSYPVPRAAFVIGRFIAIVILLALAATAFGLALLLAVLYAGGLYVQEFGVLLGLPFATTMCGLLIDVLVVAAFALFLATLSTTPVLPLALGAAFAVAGKALGPTVDYLRSGADGDEKMVAQFGPLAESVQLVLPDLSRLDWREWPLYGVFPGHGQVSWALVMAFAYIVVQITLASIIFSRREFD